MKSFNYWYMYKLGAILYLLLVGILSAIVPFVQFTTKYFNPQRPTTHIYVSYFAIWDDTVQYLPISHILTTLGIASIVSFALVAVVDGFLIPQKLIKHKVVLTVKEFIFGVASFTYLVSYYLISENINNYSTLDGYADSGDFVSYSTYDYTRYYFSTQIKSIDTSTSITFILFRFGFWVILTLPILRALLKKSRYTSTM